MADLYAGAIGQDRAVAQLRAAAKAPVHAYLFVGPPGTGKQAAAQAFAASLLCSNGGCGECSACVRALDGVHPDVVVVSREGAFISVPRAREITRLAARSPLEGSRKVLVLTEFHLVDKAGPALLKSIEEPPPGTVFVILAEQVPEELVTIASRCCRIDFGPLAAETLAAALEEDGVAAVAAAEAAEAAGGRLDRARLLASDPEFSARRAVWRGAPDRLDGSGFVAAEVASELASAAEAVLGPVRARQEAETTALKERARQYGERESVPKDVDERHRREQRRARTDELRSGFAILAAAYRDRLVAGGGAECLAAVDAIGNANEALIRNPNESLLLQALMVRLSGAATAAAGAPSQRGG